jgi:hypothetical protein
MRKYPPGRYRYVAPFDSNSVAEIWLDEDQNYEYIRVTGNFSWLLGFRNKLAGFLNPDYKRVELDDPDAETDF